MTATDRWGIDDGWFDTAGTWHRVPEATVASLRAAMGEPATARPAWVVRPGTSEALHSRCHLRLDGGEDVGEVDRLPLDLPLGIHELVPLDGGPTTNLIVSPGRGYLPSGLREWGVTMQVPTTRSRSSWGIGDLGDVATVARWVAAQGGDDLALSPLHAPTPVLPVPSSPYSPSSRRWRNPLLLDLRALALVETGPLEQRAHDLLRSPVVDRNLVWTVKQAALEQAWAFERGQRAEELTQFRSGHGPSLEGWARFCALAEVHGGHWRSWPDQLRHPDSPGVAEAVRTLADRVAFHAWLQLLLDEQLHAAASHGVRLLQDLAIGADPDGADAWLWQDLLAEGVSVGAPPDDFAPEGQQWGIPPFIPWRLRDAGYRPLAELLRSALTPGGGLRVDHVMGLVRLFWIPEGADPMEGAYVRFAGRELLEVLALESARAEAIVIGEDLGTVEPGFRAELARTGILSTRLVWFDDDPPETYPYQSVGMVTTHDLPTLVGQWSGADETEIVALGRATAPEAAAEVQGRLRGLLPHPAPTDPGSVVDEVHRRLGSAPAALVLATLEDVVGMASRPNVPGTTVERPNWSVALPVAIDDLPEAPSALSALAATRGSARSGI